MLKYKVRQLKHFFLSSVHHGVKSCGQPDCIAGKEEGDRHKGDQGVDQLRRDHRQLGLERARVKHLKYIFFQTLVKCVVRTSLGAMTPALLRRFKTSWCTPLLASEARCL